MKKTLLYPLIGCSIGLLLAGCGDKDLDKVSAKKADSPIVTFTPLPANPQDFSVSLPNDLYRDNSNPEIGKLIQLQNQTRRDHFF